MNPSKSAIMLQMANAARALDNSMEALDRLAVDEVSPEEFAQLLPREIQMGNLHPEAVLYRTEYFVKYLIQLTGKKWTLPKVKALSVALKWRDEAGEPLNQTYFQKPLVRQQYVAEVHAYTLRALQFICENVEETWKLAGGN